jgi:tetratricopeptide (TPR) repeat protein
MATYQKKGSNSKSSRNKLEELENKSVTAGVFNTLDEGASSTVEDFVIRFQKEIFITIAVVAIFVFGYMGFDKFIQQPAELNSMNEMYSAQIHFESANQTKNDSLFNLALNGADGKLGMIDIIENYSSTKASNLANYYAGMSYLNLNDYQNSIKYLSKFKSDDEILGATAIGSIADSFSQLNQFEDAFEYYEKAINYSNNGFTSPMYLLKAGYIGLEINKSKKSLAFFNRIKNEFPNSIEVTNIDALIGMASASAK